MEKVTWPTGQHMSAAGRLDRLASIDAANRNRTISARKRTGIARQWTGTVQFVRESAQVDGAGSPPCRANRSRDTVEGPWSKIAATRAGGGGDLRKSSAILPKAVELELTVGELRRASCHAKRRPRPCAGEFYACCYLQRAIPLCGPVNCIRSFGGVISPDSIPDPFVFLFPQPCSDVPEPLIRWDR